MGLGRHWASQAPPAPVPAPAPAPSTFPSFSLRFFPRRALKIAPDFFIQSATYLALVAQAELAAELKLVVEAVLLEGPARHLVRLRVDARRHFFPSFLRPAPGRSVRGKKRSDRAV